MSLREKEKQLEQNLYEGIMPDGGNTTVLELVEKYISLKTGARYNTEANYKFVTNIIKKEAFGRMRIDKVKQLDAKALLIKLQKDGRGYSTTKTLQYIMGHADIGVTLNIYTHLSFQDAKEEMTRFCANK